MNNLQPPDPLSVVGSLAENWKKFKKRYNIYAVASGVTSKQKDIQAAIFLHIMGPEAQEKLESLGLTDEEMKDVKVLMAKMEDFCLPKTNESVERHLFFMRNQKENENFDEFITDLRKLSFNCNFGSLRDSLIKDRIISGVSNLTLKDKLLKEEDLDLEKAVKLGQMFEITSQQLNTLDQGSNVQVIKKESRDFRKTTCRDREQYQRKGNSKTTNSYKFNSYRPKCGRCGSVHEFKKCPAYGKVCSKCKKLNHFYRCCKTKINVRVIENDANNVRIRSIETDAQFLGMVFSNEKLRKRWFVNLIINNIIVEARLDTGADTSVMPSHIFERLNLPDKLLVRSSAKLYNYNGSSIDVIGRCKLVCLINKVKYCIEFEVVNCLLSTPVVLGSNVIDKYNLVNRICMVEKENPSKHNFYRLIDRYYEIFSKEPSQIKDYEYDIKLKLGAVGKIEYPRKIPFKLMEPLKQELKIMENKGVIRKVNEPTEFVNSLVIVRKPKGIRICLDPQYLNSNIMREHYKLPTFEEVCAKMAGAKFFSILDASSAFWQIKLSEKSSLYTTFNTPWGRYCFLRLPYGISSAPEVFNKYFKEIFGDIDNVEIYIDDIIIWSKDENEHKIILEKVLQRAKDYNVKFNIDKCKFGLKEVIYLGHKFSDKGLGLDDNKLKAILDMKPPVNVKQLQTCLGMITYVSKFVPKLSNLTSKLRELLKKNSVWHWSHEHEEAFNKIKKNLSEKPVLQYYDVNKPVVLSVDSSKDGVAAILMQNNLPCAYASKSYNESQKNFSQIEKETYAIVFATERFHQYIYGKTDVIVETDHKPLQYIFTKPLYKCPARLQRMLIKLQPYNFKVIYKPGKEMYLADALSRNSLGDKYSIFDDEIEYHVATVINLPMSDKKYSLFQLETKKDEELQSLIKHIVDGWPQIDKLDDKIKVYYSYKDDLFVYDDLVFKGNCVIVPRSLRKDVLEKLHYNHLGINKCKNRARDCVFWPAMSKQIEDLIQNCDICLQFQNSNIKEPLMPKEIPNYPFEVVGTDLFQFQNKHFLIVIDYFSKFVEFALLPDLSSESTIIMLKSIFSRYGIPKIVYSDGGPQYTSRLFKKFTMDWNFEHRLSSPNFPQSNGMVERAIQTIKKMLKKCSVDNKDPYIALLEYRNTPISDSLQSPAEIIFKKKPNSLLPNFKNKVELKYNTIKNKLRELQYRQKLYYDRNCRELKELKKSENVFVKENGKIRRGKVVESNKNRPRSYNVMLESGQVINRNRKHLLKGSKDYKFNVKRVDNEINLDKKEKEKDTNYDVMDQNEIINKDKEYGKEIVKTRYGRIIKKPKYLIDE